MKQTILIQACVLPLLVLILSSTCTAQLDPSRPTSQAPSSPTKPTQNGVSASKNQPVGGGEVGLPEINQPQASVDSSRRASSGGAHESSTISRTTSVDPAKSTDAGAKLIDWRSRSGKVVLKASFVRLEKEKLYLMDDASKEVSTTINKLHEEDAKLAQILQTQHEDFRQYGRLRTYLSDVGQAREADLAVTDELHKLYPRSPYAGLIAGIVLACEKNDPERASRYIDDALKRLAEHRKLKPGVHTNTLCSALISRAVIFIKQEQYTKAAATLTKAIQLNSSKGKDLAVQNGLNLLEYSNTYKERVEIAKPTKSELSKVLNAFSSQIRTGIPQGGFVYSLAWELPSSDQTDAQSSTDIGFIVENNCMVCGGDGYIDCRNCNKGQVTHKEPIVVGVDPLRGPVVREKAFTSQCEVCSGKGGFRCQRCENGKLPY